MWSSTKTLGERESPGTIFTHFDSLGSHPPSAGSGLGTLSAALSQLQINVKHKCYLSLINY